MGEFGREIHTSRYFWLKTKATYPIVGLCIFGCILASINSGKNLLFNFHVSVDRRNITKWNKENQPVITMDNKKPATNALPEADNNQL